MAESQTGAAALDKHRRVFLSILFFLSGLCSLLYQTVWLRLAFAHFGVISPVISVVISIFMFGLALGSWLAAKYASSIQRSLSTSAIGLYGAAEFLIGCGAFLVPLGFNMASSALLQAGQTDSAAYLFLSAILLAATIFPWTVAMGTTVPVGLKFLQDAGSGNLREGNFGLLYVANVAGAAVGVVLTLCNIEIFGFVDTLKVAATINFLMAFFCIYWAVLQGKTEQVETSIQEPAAGSEPASSGSSPGLYSIVLFVTGFISMALELVWTRAFTVVLGTIVYSFAMLLFVYLICTCFGSLLYKLHLRRNAVFGKEKLLIVAAFSALLPLVLNDPRLPCGNRVETALLSIVPICISLGYLMPLLIDEFSAGIASRAGMLYAVNLAGSIVGPLVAGYLILPTMSVAQAMLVLAVPMFVLAVAVCLGRHGQGQVALPAVLIATGVLSLFGASFCISWEDAPFYRKGAYVVHRDYAATTVSWGEGMGRMLAVNGWCVTGLGNPTKIIAHVPLALCHNKPTDALTICFGMGATFRSLLAWDINVTAVELVPGVKQAFPFYFEDAQDVLKNPRGQIIVDDGRRYLQRCNKLFDIIALDPAPPPEAAGNSLLYSTEFYKLAKAHLKKGGILHQLHPDWTEKHILNAVARSLANSFKYVRVWRTYPKGIGFHFLASDEPIESLSVQEIVNKMPLKARTDLCQWAGGGSDCSGEIAKFMAGELNFQDLLDPEPKIIVTDDHPYNEYFMLRRMSPWQKLDPRVDFTH